MPGEFLELFKEIKNETAVWGEIPVWQFFITIAVPVNNAS